MKAKVQGNWEEAVEYLEQCLEQRSVELAIINSVQEGLSSKYEMRTIYDLVEDRLRDTFASSARLMTPARL
jgi:hypothetical protein